MEMKINIEKRHLYVIVALAVFVAAVVVIATGNAQSHPASEVAITVGGVTKSLQQAISDGDIKTKVNLPDYDSGWVNAVKATDYPFNHNLGTSYYHVLILYRKDASATYYNVANYFQQPFRYEGTLSGGGSTGAVVLEQGANSLKIRTGSYFVNGVGQTDLDAKYYQATGQYRVLLWKFAVPN